MNISSTMVISPGRITGSTIDQSIRSRPAPSSSADSTSSRGTACRVARIQNTPKDTPRPAWAITSPNRLEVRPTERRLK